MCLAWVLHSLVNVYLGHLAPASISSLLLLAVLLPLHGTLLFDFSGAVCLFHQCVNRVSVSLPSLNQFAKKYVNLSALKVQIARACFLQQAPPSEFHALDTFRHEADQGVKCLT